MVEGCNNRNCFTKGKEKEIHTVNYFRGFRVEHGFCQDLA